MENRTVSGPGLTVFDVDRQLQQTGMGKQIKYLLISADSPVSVFWFGLSSINENPVGYLAFPVDRWSTKYMVGSYTSSLRYVFFFFFFCFFLFFFFFFFFCFFFLR